jgi:class 3 adenylate cyclase
LFLQLNRITSSFWKAPAAGLIRLSDYTVEQKKFKRVIRMVSGHFKRKLSVILSADVEGYSRLMGLDEESTIRTLTNHRSAG